MFLSLVVLLLVSAALSLVAGSIHFQLESVKRRNTELNLVALSDAAVAESLAKLAYASSFSGIRERPLGGGTISSQVERLTAQHRTIRATASFAGKVRVVEVQVLRTAEGPEVRQWRRLPATPP